MSDPLSFRLASASHDNIDALLAFLRSASGQPAEVVVEGERPLAAPIVQLLLTAGARGADAPPLRIVATSPRVVDGMRLLGLGDVLAVEN